MLQTQIIFTIYEFTFKSFSTMTVSNWSKIHDSLFKCCCTCSNSLVAFSKGVFDSITHAESLGGGEWAFILSVLLSSNSVTMYEKQW